MNADEVFQNYGIIQINVVILCSCAIPFLSEFNFIRVHLWLILFKRGDERADTFRADDAFRRAYKFAWSQYQRGRAFLE
jgi:hypothetical protein